MQNDNINSCLKNSLSKNLINSFSIIAKNFTERKGYKLGENNHHLLTPKEKYIVNIFYIHSDLITTLEQIGFIEVFIRRIPYKKYLWNNLIDELTYIQYHIEVLFHKVHTVLEIMKILINEIYILKLEKKDCSWKNLISRIDRSIRPMQIINNYYKSHQGIIELRHLNTHRGFFNDKEKSDIEKYTGFVLLKLYNRMGVEIDKDLKEKISEPLIKVLIGNYRVEKAKYVRKTKEEISIIINQFLESLYDDYLKHIEEKST